MACGPEVSLVEALHFRQHGPVLADDCNHRHPRLSDERSANELMVCGKLGGDDDSCLAASSARSIDLLQLVRALGLGQHSEILR